MMKKKDLYNLHCRITPTTSNKLKEWADEQGISVGEMIDLVVKLYEEMCEEYCEEPSPDISEQLSKILERVENLEKKVGIDQV